MKIIALEANIAAGKTTLLTPLSQALNAITGENWYVLKEPVDEDPRFLELLQEYILHPTEVDSRIPFQLYITQSRQKMLQKIPDGNYIIERSLFSDIVFCQANFLATESPTAIQMDYFYKIKSALKEYPRIDLVLYLDRDPESCFQSCQLRGRVGEDQYTLSYFQDIKAFHDACLPQIVRQYNSQLLIEHLSAGFADVGNLAQRIAAVL